ncbi:MAG: phosphoadenosine phosphosulfate reductase family protein [Terriglobales bacterium]
MTPELEAKLAGRRVVASVSGGKDSAALSLWLTEQGIEHDRVFMDTGWEHPLTYEYLRGELTRVIGPIQEIRAEKQMVETIESKMMFPSRLRRFCTQQLKVYPMQRYLSALMDAGADIVNAVGIRGEESANRAKATEWEWSEGFDAEVWRPLIAWTEEQVIAIHTTHGLRPNPLYLAGARRVGCWPCIHARKSEIRLLADFDPGRVITLRNLEAKISKGAEERYNRDRAAWLVCPDPEPESGTEAHDRWSAKRDRLELPFSPPAWFQSSTPEEREINGRKVKRYPTLPIDKAIEWSRTSRGGKQFEMFAADPADAGCMRWGLCETDKPDNDPLTPTPPLP